MSKIIATIWSDKNPTPALEKEFPCLLEYHGGEKDGWLCPMPATNLSEKWRKKLLKDAQEQNWSGVPSIFDNDRDEVVATITADGVEFTDFGVTLLADAEQASREEAKLTEGPIEVLAATDKDGTELWVTRFIGGTKVFPLPANTEDTPEKLMEVLGNTKFLWADVPLADAAMFEIGDVLCSEATVN